MSCLPANGQFSSQVLSSFGGFIATWPLSACTHCLLVEQYFLMFAHLLFEPGFGNTRLADSWEAHCTTGMKRGFASAATLTTRPKKIPRSDKPNHHLRAYVIIRRMLHCLDPSEMRGQ